MGIMEKWFPGGGGGGQNIENWTLKSAHSLTG